MIGSLYSGISGLKANTDKMAVIGDNIANVNTTGFKTSRVEFANIFSANLGSSENQIGRGVNLSGVTPQWETGSVENTTSGTDLSINGQGLFVVNDPNDGTSFYSRAGNFEFDKDGNLVNGDGFYVQGYPIDIDGNLQGVDNIALPPGTSSPNPTTDMTMALNLDSDTVDGGEYKTSLTAYDSLGSPVDLLFTFTYDQTAGNWGWDVDPSQGGLASLTGSPISFNASGQLVPPAANPTITIDSLNGNDLVIDWIVLDNAGLSDGSLTSYASPSAKTAQTQDGYASGTLQGVSVDEQGVFTGLYSNGTKTPFSQLALADFASYSSLSKMGANLYASSLDSGQALVSTPGAAGLGTVTPNSLEQSNVDLASEFVDMITTQRSFQANSRVITTSDEILTELINIKR